jgi:hypothetical protein
MNVLGSLITRINKKLEIVFQGGSAQRSIENYFCTSQNVGESRQELTIPLFVSKDGTIIAINIDQISVQHSTKHWEQTAA